MGDMTMTTGKIFLDILICFALALIITTSVFITLGLRNYREVVPTSIITIINVIIWLCVIGAGLCFGEALGQLENEDSKDSFS